MKETIRLDNLSIGYRGKGNAAVVAEGISACVRSGELTCLLGANGVGKSTLLRTLSAFQPKLGGSIYINGREIGDFTDKEMARTVGVVLTDKPDVHNMSAKEMVSMGRSPYTGFWGRCSEEDINPSRDRSFCTM
ncbi:MAG: ATP-binding cassette domain-containing protein, partial [Prevotella sp.]